MKDAKLVLSNVNYTIKDKEILKDINISISEGERIAICGPNGAGKSTLINLMLNVPGIGFHHKTHKLSGTIENTLFDLKQYKDVKVHLQNSKIAYNLYLKVEEILSLCFGKNIPYDLINDMNLSDKMKNQVKTLSGGELQKLNIILVIASNPNVIFLDEMTTGLDYEAKKEIISYIKRYLEKSKITLIFITHYLEEITQLAESVYFLKQGKIVEHGKLDELFSKYKLEDSNICGLYEEVIVNV